MDVGGSQQLRLFRRAIRDGASIEDAAAIGLMSITEAQLWLKDDAANPPPPEAYELLYDPDARAVPGHNNPPETPDMAEETDNRLRLLVERVERLEEEKKGIGDDIRDVYAEAKAVGYDPKIMRKVIKLRKIQADARREMDMLLDTYCTALGMQMNLPLGVAS